MPQNNPDVHDFLIRLANRRHSRTIWAYRARFWQALKVRLPPAELTATRRRPTRGTGTGALVLVTEDQAALFQIVRRHFDRDPIACQRLDPVLLHLAGGVGNDLVPGVELHAVARVREDFGHQSFELDQLFFGHICLQIDRGLALRPMGTVGLGIRAALAMQEGDALNALAVATLRRTRRLMPGRLRRGIITTSAAGTARAF